MTWQATPFQILLFFTTIASLGLAVYATYYSKQKPGERYVLAFAALCFSVTVWAFFYGVQISLVDLEAKLLAYKLLHFGGVIVPAAWFVFALTYTSNSRWVSPSTIAALHAIPLALLVSLFFDPFNLALLDATLTTDGNHVALVTENGPLYNLFLAYSYALLLLGSAIIATHVFRSPSQFRRQSALLVAGALVPLFFNLWNVFGIPPLGAISFNLTPVSLAVSTFLFAVAIFHYDLFDLTPVARATVLDTMGEGVIVLDAEERVVDLNDAARDLLTGEGLIGKRAEDVIPWFGELDTHSVSTFELDASGDEAFEERVVRVVKSPVTQNGVTSGWVLIVQDVTELEAQRQTLQRQNTRLEMFASTVSHDLRNPLSLISGYSELAQQTGEDEHFDEINNAVDRMETFLEELLVLAKQGQTIEEKTRVSLADLAADVMGTIEGDVTLQLETEKVIMADCARLRQVLSNLFRNAAAHGGDDVTVRVGDLPDGFYVEDDGVGIPGDRRDEIFNYGFTTSNEGTGFGLAIVHDIVEAHGWEIKVVEGADGGARFEITNVDQY